MLITILAPCFHLFFQLRVQLNEPPTDVHTTIPGQPSVLPVRVLRSPHFRPPGAIPRRQELTAALRIAEVFRRAVENGRAERQGDEVGHLYLGMPWGKNHGIFWDIMGTSYD